MLSDVLSVSTGGVTTVMPSFTANEPLLPLKLVFYGQTFPHEAMIAQMFYQSAGLNANDWEQQANAVCYHAGIGRNYLDNCLAKVRVFNPNHACIDCGRYYEVFDPTQAITPISNVSNVAYATTAEDTSLGLSNGEQMTGAWRCVECERFKQNGQWVNNEACEPNF